MSRRISFDVNNFLEYPGIYLLTNKKDFMETTAVETQEKDFRKWGALIVLSLALAIIIIDTTVLNVALATIIREFKTTIQNIQWVITAYSLTLAALTITGGRLGDIFGRKKMFMLGALIFAIGSTITSLSTTVPVMIWGEAIIEGVGAALMMPATASLLVSIFHGKERAIAFGIWGGIAGASSAIGPILGGWLTSNYSWRWAFRINIFVAAALLIGAALILKEYRDTEEKPKLDFVGVILSALGLLGVVFGFIEASQYGWWKAKEAFMIADHAIKIGSLSIVPAAIFLGIVFLVLFFLWEARMQRLGKTPLVSLKLFQNRQFASSGLSTTILTLGLSGLVFSLPVFLQAVRNLDALHTGLTLLPLSLTVLVVSPIAAVMAHKISPKYIVMAGMLINAISYIVLRQMLNVDATAWTIAPGLILFGLGMALVMSQINNMALSSVSVQEAGEASGVLNTLRQVGSTLGSAIIGSILLTSLSANLVSGVNKSTVIPESAKPQIAEAISTQTSNVEFEGGAELSEQLPPSIATEIKNIGHEATVKANKRTLGFGAFFALLGFLSSFFLPKTKIQDKGQSVAGH